MSSDKRDGVPPPHADGAGEPRIDGVGHPQRDGVGYPHFDGVPVPDASTADPHGRAALLLVESLIHALVDKGALTRGEAIDVIDIATDVEEELAHAADGGAHDRRKSLLAPLATSFRSELGE